MSKKNFFYFLTLLGFVSFAACTGKGKKIPNVSNIKIDVEVKQFHQQLFSLDTNDIQNEISELRSKFPEFFDLYFFRIVPFRQSLDLTDDFYKNVKGFLGAERIRKLADTVAVIYDDFSKIEKDFEQAFQFYKYYFPEKNIPHLYPLISEFGYANFIFPINDTLDAIGIGLDMFLGNDYPYWQMARENPAFSQYIVRTFNEEHLVKKSMDVLIDDLFRYAPGDRLLDIMIFNGKKLFVLDKLLPHTPDSIQWEYTTPQTNWVKNNEKEIWAHLLKEKLLYETSPRRIKKLVDQSPTSPGMPPESPGRTANFMGLKIVQAYIQRYPETTLEELIAIENAQEILDKSKYKPR